jgi:hypothetical protein
MNILRFFSTFGSKRSGSRTEGESAPPAAAPPRAASGDKAGLAKAKGQRQAPPVTTKTEVPGGKRRQAPPAANAATATSAPTSASSPQAARAPLTGAAATAPQGGSDQARPAIQIVGSRGETDLAPGRATAEHVSFPAVEGSGDDVDRAAIRELFSEIAAGQSAPIKTFIRDLRAKTATKEWLEVCRPVMAILFESATSLGLADAAQPMSEFISALDLAAESQQGKDGPINAAARDVLLEAYQSLLKAFPAAFSLDETSAHRASMLLHALLKQVHGVGIVTLDALYGAGLASLDALYQATPDDLSTTTGVPAALCEAICKGLREHRLEVERTAHLPAELRYNQRLKDLLRALTREQSQFEKLDEESGFNEARAERKRAARRDRNLCALKIEATLIEMGEVDRADQLRALSFDRRISHLEAFLGVRVGTRAAEQR